MNRTDKQFTRVTKQLFSRWAAYYDSRLFRLYFERLYTRILEILTRHNRAMVVPGAKLLDIACGSGEIIFRLAQQFPQTQFYGIDITTAMVEVARRKNHRLPNVAIQEGDADHLPFPDQVFDILLCSEAFHHFPNPAVVLREMHRVLVVGGLLFVVDPGFPSRFMTRITEMISRTFEINHHVYAQGELQQLLEQHGFVVQSVSHYFFNSFIVCIKK